VKPIDSKITMDIVIPAGAEYPETSVSPVPSVVKTLEPQRAQRTTG